MIDINKLITKARKEHNTVNLVAYQNIKAEIQKYETSKNAKPLDDAKQLEIINKYAKSLEDSISQFKQAGRHDLELGYIVELEVIKSLLPEPVSGQKILEFIHTDNYFSKYCYIETESINDEVHYKKVIISIPKKDMGACIKYIKSKFPIADGKEISNIIKALVI